MRKKTLSTTLVLVIAAVAILASSAGAAIAAPTTYLTGIPFNVEGDSAYWFGNHGTTIRWYNKNVTITTTPTIGSFVPTSTISLNYLAYSLNGSAFTSITATPKYTFSADGRYSIVATGANLIGTSYEATAALGIDTQRPSSGSNVVPVYDATATVILHAADALSGPEYLVYNLDKASEWATPTPSLGATSSFDVTLTVTTAGKHTLSYFIVDNAGNHSSSHGKAFVINAIGYKPVLGRPTATVRKHKVTYKGSVTAAATKKSVTLTVERKKGKSWKSFAKYKVYVAKYMNKYSWAKTNKKSGTYRLRASQGTGRSAWSKSFKIK